MANSGRRGARTTTGRRELQHDLGGDAEQHQGAEAFDQQRLGAQPGQHRAVGEADGDQRIPERIDAAGGQHHQQRLRPIGMGVDKLAEQRHEEDRQLRVQEGDGKPFEGAEAS